MCKHEQRWIRVVSVEVGVFGPTNRRGAWITDGKFVLHHLAQAVAEQNRPDENYESDPHDRYSGMPQNPSLSNSQRFEKNTGVAERQQ